MCKLWYFSRRSQLWWLKPVKTATYIPFLHWQSPLLHPIFQFPALLQWHLVPLWLKKIFATDLTIIEQLTPNQSEWIHSITCKLKYMGFFFIAYLSEACECLPHFDFFNISAKILKVPGIRAQSNIKCLTFQLMLESIFQTYRGLEN